MCIRDSARAELTEAVSKAGYDYIMMEESETRYGAVETIEEGKKFARFLDQNRGCLLYTSHQIGPAMVDFARRAKVPVCVHLDHGTSMEVLEQAVELGFTSVMFDGSALPYEENKAETRQAVEYVHSHGVSLEAELGCMATVGGTEGMYTDPALAADFVSATGVDALAIAFGTCLLYTSL